MGSSAAMEVKGMEQLRRAFSRMPEKVEKKVVRGAMGAMARPMKKAMISRMPEDTGELKRNFTTRFKHYWARSVSVTIIGARSKWIPVPKSVRWTKSGYMNPAKYAHLTGGDKGPHAERWMERGFDAAKASAKDRFWRAMKRGIEREAKRMGFR